jgi:hypothetical protein
MVRDHDRRILRYLDQVGGDDGAERVATHPSKNAQAMKELADKAMELS